jgi:hypothetical protein
MTFWLITWGATSGAGVAAFYALAVRDPAVPAPHIAAAGPVLAAVFMAVQLPASLLAAEVARVVWRRVEYRRVRRQLARIVAGYPA